MAYEIIATDPDTGECVAELVTKIHHEGAHFLMGALDVYYETDDEEGCGDTFKYTDAELSAAEEALAVLQDVALSDEGRLGLGQAQVFLHDVRDWMSREAARAEVGIETMEIEIGFF